MTYVILILGALGLLLTAGSVLGLVLEVARTKAPRWQLMVVAAVGYLLAFGSEPPPALVALGKPEDANLHVSVRALTLGMFLALLTRAHILKCREGGK